MKPDTRQAWFDVSSETHSSTAAPTTSNPHYYLLSSAVVSGVSMSIIDHSE
jgi:hypothetical protein